MHYMCVHHTKAHTNMLPQTHTHVRERAPTTTGRQNLATPLLKRAKGTDSVCLFGSRAAENAAAHHSYKWRSQYAAAAAAALFLSLSSSPTTFSAYHANRISQQKGKD